MLIKRIIIHWSAGTYYPNTYEKQCYHYLVDKNGKIYEGIYKPEDNVNCQDGLYATHTGGGNTGSIGIAMCAMAGFKNPQNVGSYPITLAQFEACMKLCAGLCHKYMIEINPLNVMTHYEFGQKNPNTSSSGKIDIIFLPPYAWVPKDDVGSFIRSKIRWYKQKYYGG